MRTGVAGIVALILALAAIVVDANYDSIAVINALLQGELADRLEVEPITLCRMIDRLEEAELVERRRAPSTSASPFAPMRR